MAHQMLICPGQDASTGDHGLVLRFRPWKSNETDADKKGVKT